MAQVVREPGTNQAGASPSGVGIITFSKAYPNACPGSPRYPNASGSVGAAEVSLAIAFWTSSVMFPTSDDAIQEATPTYSNVMPASTPIAIKTIRHPECRFGCAFGA